MKNTIAEKRKELGLTQSELATILGVDYTQVQRWERSRSTPLVTVAIDIARALNTTVEELFILEDDE